MASKPPKNGRAAELPWYAEGLQFECQEDCGRCCTNHGDYAYVYLEETDLHRLRRYFGLNREQFLERYTTVDDGFVVLRMDRPACPFLEGSRCTVYEARPVQCRTFPFWEEHLRSRKAWNGTEKFCPGINRGPIHSLRMIRRRLEERRR
jgi:Fe-S-cluster containining protein